jgi:hypothetical protein
VWASRNRQALASIVFLDAEGKVLQEPLWEIHCSLRCVTKPAVAGDIGVVPSSQIAQNGFSVYYTHH